MYSTASALPIRGTFTLAYLQSLRHFCTETTQKLIHPDYFDQQANWYRLISLEGKGIALKVSPDGEVQWNCREGIENSKVLEHIQRLFPSNPLPDEAMRQLPEKLKARFLVLRPLVRIASVSLGEALMKAIIRQVITAQHAKRLIASFIQLYGEKQIYEGDIYYSFPSLETISQVPLEELQREGLGFKAKVVQRTALYLLEHNVEARIAQVSTEEALDQLMAIKGIGRWTAHVALCDLRSDWSYYPFEDLAVRTWAKKLWGERQWPQDEHQFAALWQQIHGDYAGIITLYLLSCAGTERLAEQLVSATLF